MKSDNTSKIITFITTKLRKYFDDSKVSFFGVSVDPEDEQKEKVKQITPGIRYFWDFDRSVSYAYGASILENPNLYIPFTLVLDPLLRVIANIPFTDIERHNNALLGILNVLPEIDNHAAVPLNAPVLVLPRVFEPEFCKELIKLYKKNGGMESGFMREKDGNTIGIIDYSFKRRQDFSFDIFAGLEDLRDIICAKLQRRLVPEIYKSFQFQVTRIERYVVACYESEVGGFFRPHRDNTTKGTAHRRFACTINLNAEEYEGGDLRFPEFGTRTYRAPTGGAVVFSCSLLHEATPVKSGTRYAFLPFLYDDAAAKIRDENKKFIKEEEIISPA
ncbi:MAG: hypothetical protein Tsb006_3080 [Rickettsiaceae bacterium]